MEGSQAAWRGLPVLGLFRGFAIAGLEPDEMGIGPIYAIPKLLKLHGLNIGNIDLWELNEAYASQAVYCIDRLGLPPAKVNVDGGAISIGHPFGMTGARQLGHALIEGKTAWRQKNRHHHVHRRRHGRGRLVRDRLRWTARSKRSGSSACGGSFAVSSTQRCRITSRRSGRYHGSALTRPSAGRWARKCWIGMTWPRRYGGHERSAMERYTVLEEMLAAGAPVGAHWTADRQSGPLLLRFGTEAQRERFLPGIARGEVYFCIGMSEPQSGSDLCCCQDESGAGRCGMAGHRLKIMDHQRA